MAQAKRPGTQGARVVPYVCRVCLLPPVDPACRDPGAGSDEGVGSRRAANRSTAAGANHGSQHPQTSPDPSPNSQRVGAGGSYLRILPGTDPDPLTVPGGQGRKPCCLTQAKDTNRHPRSSRSCSQKCSLRTGQTRIARYRPGLGHLGSGLATWTAPQTCNPLVNVRCSRKIVPVVCRMGAAIRDFQRSLARRAVRLLLDSRPDVRPQDRL
jgi:hypothetical protein